MNCGDWCSNAVSNCAWFQTEERRNTYASVVSGLLFATGWWILIDAVSVFPGNLPGPAHICGVLATLSLFMVNAVSNAQVRGDTFSNGCMGPRGARLWLFIGFVLGFASLIAASWILFANYIHADNKKLWPGLALFLQNAFIFMSSLVFKFGRSEDHWG